MSFGTDRPDFSVLIGLASTEDGERIMETLQSLRHQIGGHACEVIIADRRDDAISRGIERDYPEAVLLRCSARTTLPGLRAAALERASGRYVAVTEDHCVPASDWLDAIAKAFRVAPAGTAAVGGCVENGVSHSALDRATFLCEYSAFLTPVAEGATAVLPGMNVAYERDALARLDRSLLTEGFWETTVHPALLLSGRGLFSTNGIKLEHRKKFSFSHFVRQRYLYSRYYAALRFGRTRRARRALAFAVAPALPFVLLWRMTRQMSAKGRLGVELPSALPFLAVFFVIWAWGEMVGYALGAGDALRRIE